MIHTFEQAFIRPQIKAMMWQPCNKRAEMIENILTGILIGMCVFDYLILN